MKEGDFMPIRLTGMNSGLDTEAMVSELVKAYSKKTDKIQKKKTTTEWKQNAWNDLNKKIQAFQKKAGAFRFSGTYNKKKTTVNDGTKASVITDNTATLGTQTLKINKISKTAYLTGASIGNKNQFNTSTKLSELGIESGEKITIKKENGDDKLINIDSDMSIGDFVGKLNESGLNAKFDSSTGRFFINGKASGKDNDFDIEGNLNVLNKLGLNTNNGATKIDGQDSEIELNGAIFTSNTNSYNINGLNINVFEETDKEIIINTTNDIDGIYNNIKSFIKDYTKLINEFDALYNAPSAGSYEPLTDKEKEAMSDKDIEKWEKKVKDSLLRRDGNLNSISNLLKNTMLQSYDVNGKKMSLSNFGIGTLGYFTSADNEKNALHIDGDDKDDDVSGNVNKLKQMISSNSEDVEEFFSQLTENIYSKLNDLSRSSTTRSYGKFFDDKQLNSTYKDYEKKVSDMEKYVSNIEDKYYKQFTKMETTLAKLQSQQSYFTNMFG